MVWIKFGGVFAQAYIEVSKICAVVGNLKEKSSDSQNLVYILEGEILIHSCSFQPLPICNYEYNMGIPKINKKIKNPDKQKENLKKWKLIAFNKAKLKHDQRVFKVVHCIEKIRNQKEKHIAFDFMKFLQSIDSVD